MVVGALRTRTDLLVIGAGPGGYVAAIRAAELGRTVTVIEPGPLGGVCLNVGCIPSKALIHVADTLHRIHTADRLGIQASASLDLAKAQAWKDGVVTRLRGGIAGLFKHYQIELIEGKARFTSSTSVHIEGKGDVTDLDFSQCILATGSRPRDLAGLPFDGQFIISSTDIFSLGQVPGELVVVGGGYIGVEMGMLFAKLGSKVTTLEFLDHIQDQAPEDTRALIVKKMEQLGITIRTGARIDHQFTDNGRRGIHVVPASGSGFEPFNLYPDKVLISVGRTPNTDDIGLESTQVKVDTHGQIPVDTKLRTSDPHILAIGDIVPGPMLAHKAMYEGRVAAEAAGGGKREVDYTSMPWCIFSDPEVSMTGMTLDEAKKKDIDAAEAKVPLASIGRSLTLDAPEGHVRIVFDAKTHRVIGAEVVGASSSDIISELTLAIEMGALLEDIAYTIHPHPTMPEAIMEAAEKGLGTAIHSFGMGKK
ncbi:MAG: dihydrolipoyl dehydrogenase [Nanoarchaeota archaeon]